MPFLFLTLFSVADPDSRNLDANPGFLVYPSFFLTPFSVADSDSRNLDANPGFLVTPVRMRIQTQFFVTKNLKILG
jgi:hypothetical protein